MGSTMLRSIATAAVLAFSVACSGAPAANQGEPAGAVKSAMDAAQSGGLANLSTFACAAKQGDIADLFGATGDLSGLGVDANEVFDAMKMEFKDIQTTENSRNGDSAVVHVTGTMTVTLDPAKMRELMKKMMAAQGQSVDDAMLDAAIAGMSSQLTQEQALDEDVTVVKEGGKWLLCG